jgi:hypothetical protein
VCGARRRPELDVSGRPYDPPARVSDVERLRAENDALLRRAETAEKALAAMIENRGE